MDTAETWSEIKALQEGCLRVWGLYMQWYTWFYGASLLALGLVVTANDGKGVHGNGAVALSIVFAVLAMLGVVVTIYLGKYMTGVHAQLDKLSRSTTSTVKLQDLVGGVVGDYACRGMLIALLVLIGAWVFIGVEYGKLITVSSLVL